MPAAAKVPRKLPKACALLRYPLAHAQVCKSRAIRGRPAQARQEKGHKAQQSGHGVGPTMRQATHRY